MPHLLDALVKVGLQLGTCEEDARALQHQIHTKPLIGDLGVMACVLCWNQMID